MSASFQELAIRNPRYRRQESPDRLPLPPSRLVYLVQGNYSLRGFCLTAIRERESTPAPLLALRPGPLRIRRSIRR